MKKSILSLVILLCCVSTFSQKRIDHIKTREEKLNEQYCTGLFNTPEGIYFELVNDHTVDGYNNILDWLQGRAAGLQVYTLKNNTRLPLIRNSLAGIYVDEIQRDPDFLNSLSVTDIAMIKIIKGPFAGGFNSPGGAIAIYPKDGDEE